MSKIKTTQLNITPHQKSKLRRHLRRKETAATKNNRIKKAGQFGYGYRYYVKDSRDIRETYEVTIPATDVPVKHVEHIRREHIDKNGKVRYIDDYHFITDGYKHIPEHTVKRSRYIETVPTEPYIKQKKLDRKKWIRRQAAKKIRNMPIEQLLQRGVFKKAYDIWWSLW